jgi:hypothetical protein
MALPRRRWQWRDVTAWRNVDRVSERMASVGEHPSCWRCNLYMQDKQVNEWVTMQQGQFCIFICIYNK